MSLLLVYFNLKHFRLLIYITNKFYNSNDYLFQLVNKIIILKININLSKYIYAINT